ncbi:MAG TPA: helix-turn-helix domain-containing protein [Nevskia sp.]|jgi:DNA-binding HxlR family transcriptional regulator|nr:helix-turn-helix domain-containing protein [Nevskia sp.]
MALQKQYICPINIALDLIGGKWKPMILWQIGKGRRRFSSLQAAMPGIAHKVLSEQLRQLQRDGVVLRVVREGKTQRIEYELTALGDSLRPMLNGLASWGKTHHRKLGAVLAC